MMQRWYYFSEPGALTFNIALIDSEWYDLATASARSGAMLNLRIFGGSSRSMATELLIKRYFKQSKLWIFWGASLFWRCNTPCVAHEYISDAPALWTMLIAFLMVPPVFIMSSILSVKATISKLHHAKRHHVNSRDGTTLTMMHFLPLTSPTRVESEFSCTFNAFVLLIKATLMSLFPDNFCNALRNPFARNTWFSWAATTVIYAEKNASLDDGPMRGTV